MMKYSTAVQSPHTNLFAHSDFGLDTLQARIFTLLLENITSYTEWKPVRVRLEDALGPNPNQHHYCLLEEALDCLSSKRLRQPGKERTCGAFFPLFQELSYCKGHIEAVFSAKSREPLRELTSRFTMAEIRKLVELRHSHPQRLFWFLRAHVGQRKLELTVEDLKDVLLGVRKYRHKDAEYERYYDFKTRVVDQAIKAVRDRGLLDIRYREYRVKRNVVRLVITVNSCSAAPVGSPHQLAMF